MAEADTARGGAAVNKWRVKVRRPSMAETDTARVVRELVRLARDEAAHLIFASLTQREVTAGVSEVDETATEMRLTRGQVVSVFKQLAETGCGRFVVGRKGHPSRFEWEFTPSSIGAAALKQRPDLDPFEPEVASHTQPPKLTGEMFDELFEESSSEREEGRSAAPPVTGDQVIEHAYRLRPDFTVRLVLPASLRKGEAERLAAFIRTLPFE